MSPLARGNGSCDASSESGMPMATCVLLCGVSSGMSMSSAVLLCCMKVVSFHAAEEVVLEKTR